MDASTPPEAFNIDLPTPATNPRQLALGAWIHGGPRGPADRLRVLELGAGAGSNLLPLAFYNPGDVYVGLDADAEQVTLGRAAAAELGLENVRFDVVAFQDLPPKLDGPFDCILVRDLFARVSEAARAEILSLCYAHLAPEGLVYVDYPVAPGGVHQAMVRELLQPLLVGEEGVTAGAAEVREKARALRGLIAKTEHPYPSLLAMELTRAAEVPLLEMWREYLHGSSAVLFHREVAQQAARHGLRYVYDAAFNRPEGYVPAGLREELLRLGLKGDAMEQAIDIFCHRQARSSVFCRGDGEVGDGPGPAALDQMFIASSLSPANDPPRLDPGIEESFLGPFGQRIGSVDPLLKASLLVLRDLWPGAISFAELMSRAVGLLHRNGAEGVPGDDQLAGTANDLWALYHRGLLDLHLSAPKTPPSPARTLHALARHEAKTRTALTTPTHTLLSLSGFDAALVRRMGVGVSDDALVGALVTSITSGEIPLELGGTRLTDPLLLEPMVRGLLRRVMVTLGKWGLLEGGREDPDRAERG